MCTSKPKIQAPTPVIERQAYKTAPSRDSLSSGSDPNTRRRVIAGVETSAQGVPGDASTTRRVKAGGDQSLFGPIGGGGAVSPGAGIGGDTNAAQVAVAAPYAAVIARRLAGGGIGAASGARRQSLRANAV